MLFTFASVCASALLSIPFAACSVPSDDSDLEIFVSRPDIRPPKFEVNVYEPHLVTPGYWFVAPYGSLREKAQSRTYATGQTGPHIYDGQGQLIWSGAHVVDQDRPTFDFKAIDANGTQHLSILVYPAPHSSYYPGGVGLTLDHTLSVSSATQSRAGSGMENMHEFNIIDNGKKALMVTYRNRYEDISTTDNISLFRSIGDTGFVEKDITTGEVVFEWWALDHIKPNESNSRMPLNIDDSTWDWFHLNSVDKNGDGDYLISSRYTSTVYKISGIDGSIIWRLGGPSSSFAMDGFNFSSQHDARFREDWQDPGHERNSATTHVSLLNNAADDIGKTANVSSGMIISLNTKTMTASLVSEFIRPDKRLTRLRGNLQILPGTKNVVGGWSENAYVSEFTADGRHVLDASFTSSRFVTYRAYKFNFTSDPAEKPVIKAFVYGEEPPKSVSVFYVSWNGATEITAWKFFASKDSTSPLSDFSLVGNLSKSGFETTHMTSGYFERAYAQAIAADGTLLGETVVEFSKLPSGWSRSNETSATHDVSNISTHEKYQEVLHRWVSTYTARSGSLARSTFSFSAVAAGLMVMLFILIGCSGLRRSRMRNRCMRLLS